jgi:hypothetical protein
MAQYTGKDLYVSFDGQVVGARFRSLKTKEEIDLKDQSAGSDVAKTYLNALEDGDAQLEFLDVAGGTAATALWQVCDKGAEGDLIWAPEGTASGKPKHTVNAIVKTREREFPYDDVVSGTITFQFSGAVSDSAYA